MSESIYIQNHTLRHAEVSRDGFLKLRSLFDLLQEAAADHAIELGCGMPYLAEKNLLWVLSAIRIRNFRVPIRGEKLRIETWPTGFQRLFATREFVWLTESGETLGIASSRWLLLAGGTLRPQRPETTLSVPLPLPKRPRYFEELPKLESVSGDFPFLCTVRDSQIDLNQHLNNAEYAAFVQDWLFNCTGCSPRFSEVQIQFLSEVKCGETLSVCGKLTHNQFQIEGGKSVPCFRAAGMLLE